MDEGVVHSLQPESEAVVQEEQEEEQETQNDEAHAEGPAVQETADVVSVSGLGRLGFPSRDPCVIPPVTSPSLAQSVNVVAPIKDFSPKRPKVSTDSFRESPYSSIGVASSRLFVGNLNYGIAWQTLKDHFKIAGDVCYAKILTDRDGSSKGCGIVEFRSNQEASRAIAMLQGTRINNYDRPINIREDHTEQRGRRSRASSAGGGSSRQSGSNRYAGGSDDHRHRHRHHQHHQQQHYQHPHHQQQHQHYPVRRPSRQGRQIFVDNLPYNFGWLDLKNTFVPYGAVEKAEIQGARGGRGIVLFSKAEEAEKAVAASNGQLAIEGRRIYTKMDSHTYRN